MTILFWTSLTVIFYAYAGYPLLLWALTGMKGRRPAAARCGEMPALPRVSLIISAHNEARIMEEKILNSLSLDYPAEKLEIVVVSDGSDDGTDEIVKRFADRGVVLKRCEGRIGKTACLNETVPFVTGEIVVFSDANSLYDQKSVRELAGCFYDEQVGFATGSTRYSAGEDNGVMQAVGLYSRIEQFTKKRESLIGSCVGADGAIFAIRKELYPRLRAVDINDLVIPLSIIRQGMRGLFADAAFCGEKTAKDVRGEFLRQVRITNRTIRALVHYRGLFNPFRYGFFSLQIFSHKLCKLVIPFFLVLLFLSNALSAGSGPFYASVLAGQIVFYTLGFSGCAVRRGTVLKRVVSVAETFLLVNAAIFQGWVKFFRGETFTTWNTAR